MGSHGVRGAVGAGGVAALVTTYGYNSVGDVTSIDENGRSTAYEYDNAGNLTKVTLPDPDGAGSLPAPVTKYGYDDAGRLTSATESYVGASSGNERVTSYVYDGFGRLQTLTLPDPDGAGSLAAPVHEYGYDARHRLAWQDDPLDHRTGYAYDDAGNLTTVTLADPDGAGSLTSPVHSYAYDAIGRLTSHTAPDPDGAGSQVAAVTTYTYDAASQVTSVTPPATAATDYAYDALGRLTSVSGPDPDGAGSRGRAVTTYAYNSAGRLVTGADPDGAGGQAAPVTTYAYDDLGRITSVTDALSHVTTYTYDRLDQLKTVTAPDPDGAGSQTAGTTTYVYNAFGELTSVTDSLNHATSYGYDTLGRRTSVTDPLLGVTTYGYDAYGNLASLTDPESNVTSWAYDGLHRVVSEIDPRGETTTYAYDAASRVTAKVDRLDRKRTYYDDLDRLTTETWLTPAGGGTWTTNNTITRTYDTASRLTLVEDGSSKYAYSYDTAGRMLTEDNQNNAAGVPRTVVTSTYDSAGLRTELKATDPGDSTKNDFKNTYTYDDAGRLTRVTQQGQTGGRTVAAKRVDLTYDLLDRFDVITRYADLSGTQLVATTDYTFDNAGRLMGLTHAKGGTGLGTYSYGYDAANRLTSATLPTASGPDTVTYSYDNTDQLTGADHSAQTDETYAYDDNGNRTSNSSVVATGNRITEDASYTYQYDDEGNLTRETKKSDSSYVAYTWDHRNRLTKAGFRTSAGTLTKQVAYDYDTENRLIRRRVDSNGDGTYDAAQKFVYDGTQAVLVYDGSNAVTDRMTWGPEINQLFADENTTNGVLWALTDQQGTVRDLVTYNAGTDTTSVANHLDYDSFGNVVAQTAATVGAIFRYTGRFYDVETGKQWNLNRWYDARTGRWLSQDPIGFEAEDSNLNRYVGNSPTDFTDPSGLFGGSIRGTRTTRGMSPLRPVGGPNGWIWGNPRNGGVDGYGNFCPSYTIPYRPLSSFPARSPFSPGGPLATRPQSPPPTRPYLPPGWQGPVRPLSPPKTNQQPPKNFIPTTNPPQPPPVLPPNWTPGPTTNGNGTLYTPTGPGGDAGVDSGNEANIAVPKRLLAVHEQIQSALEPEEREACERARGRTYSSASWMA